MDSHGPVGALRSIEMTLSDPAELPRLRAWLRAQGVGDVRYRAVTPAPGELGAVDVLTVLAGSSVLTAAVRTLPDFLRARRSRLRAKVTIGEQQVEFELENVEEALRIVERLLGDQP